MLDVELKGTPEHAAVKNDPKKALAAVYDIRKGWKPKKIYYDVVINLGKKLDAFFASYSACTNPGCWIPERTREKLKKKEVRSSAGAQEVIPCITDDFTRNLVLDWVSGKRRIPARCHVYERSPVTLSSAPSLPLGFLGDRPRDLLISERTHIVSCKVERIATRLLAYPILLSDAAFKPTEESF